MVGLLSAGLTVEGGAMGTREVFRRVFLPAGQRGVSRAALCMVDSSLATGVLLEKAADLSRRLGGGLRRKPPL